MSFSQSNTNRQLAYYAQDVDFDDLAERDPDWVAICKATKESKWIDFQDPRVLLYVSRRPEYVMALNSHLDRQLTKSLLKCDFGLSLDLPDDRLCPPVPVRWNYVRWIQELLDTTSGSFTDSYNPDRVVTGLDIGVGASAIYPLLATSTRPKWCMVGTDIDEHSLEYAKQNINTNGLSANVKLGLMEASAPLVPLDKIHQTELDFVMTNPPFYSSFADMRASYGSKSLPPSAVCTGSDNEMICPGGDVGFVLRILEESLKLRDKVQWYTAMLGKMSSLQQIVAKLRENSITNFAVTSLQAGHRTKRWAIAWSFQDLRPRNDIARHGELVHAVLPHSTAHTIAVPLMNADWAGKKVDMTIKDLDVRWQWRPNISTGVMLTSENVWSRAARRKKKFGNQEADSNHLTMGSGDDSSGDDEPVALAVMIVASEEKVEVRWLRGTDHVHFESFCGMLKRNLTHHD
jgi:23S rRNA (adenine1618-N6)-methyltransferase